NTTSSQFTIPETLIAEPTVKSDLVFHYKANPFAFWIPCRSASPTMPLFDTRVFSLPETPIGPVISAHTSMALHNFSSVFEDQYIHVASAHLLGGNGHEIGEVVSNSGIR
ncbi:hypothetical protein B0H14DRAFT_2266882, partial [Mycena olivaceomarginata]